MSNTFTGKVSGRMSSRGWAIALGIGAVVLAAILLVVYLDRYRARVGGENAPTPVLVAKQLIPQGTPGTHRRDQLDVRADDASAGRKSRSERSADPSYLAGRAAAVDIFPGQQITSTDFAASDTASVDSQITGTQRAFSISIDGVHGSLSQVQAGDSVDVYTSVGRRREALRARTSRCSRFRPFPARAVAANLVLRIETKRSRRSGLYAADNTQLIFVLRPVVGAKPTKPSRQMQLRC